MLSEHPCRMPHLTGIDFERDPFRLSLAEKLEKKIKSRLEEKLGFPIWRQ